ncbi:MAG: hypothetical protein KJ638_07655 [Chloroflexi bacterium]|nr:hypothetical protein [Chloroflexota bacterium]
MPSVKTAISIQEPLFEQVKNLARELEISRSRLFVLAVEEFIQRYQNKQIVNEINQAYDDLPNTIEQAHLSKMRRQHRQMVEGE